MAAFEVGDRFVVVRALGKSAISHGFQGAYGVITAIGNYGWGAMTPRGQYSQRLDGGDLVGDLDNGCEGTFKFSEIRKLPPDDTRDALPRWCRNLFDIDMDQSQPVRKPVNNVK